LIIKLNFESTDMTFFQALICFYGTIHNLNINCRVGCKRAYDARHVSTVGDHLEMSRLDCAIK